MPAEAIQPTEGSKRKVLRPHSISSLAMGNTRASRSCEGIEHLAAVDVRRSGDIMANELVLGIHADLTLVAEEALATFAHPPGVDILLPAILLAAVLRCIALFDAGLFIAGVTQGRHGDNGVIDDLPATGCITKSAEVVVKEIELRPTKPSSLNL